MNYFLYKGGELYAGPFGACGFVVSSSNNSRPPMAAVMAEEDQFEVVRERETVEALVKGERVASFRQDRQPAVPMQ